MRLLGGPDLVLTTFQEPYTDSIIFIRATKLALITTGPEILGRGELLLHSTVHGKILQ